MSQALVAYFSASGVTAGLAKKLTSAIGADIFEIKPEVPYTQADLDWTDSKSRSTVEMKDKSCRPAIAEKCGGMADYSVVFVGFPVWWYREPSIIDSFLEAYDFTGKTIVPFCTSGGSGLGDTEKIMQSVAKEAKITGGKRFASTASETELAEWAKAFI